MKIHVQKREDSLEVQVSVMRPVAWPLIELTKRILMWYRRRRRVRTPGLHAGAYQVRDDFDDPLPEDFLITGS